MFFDKLILNVREKMETERRNEEAVTNKIVKNLAELSEKERRIVYKALEMNLVRDIPVEQTASVIGAFHRGRRVAFTDKEGKVHVGKIQRLNQRFIKVRDESEGKDYGVLPDELKIATEKDTEMATKQVAPQKRKYTRRGLGTVEPTNVKTDEHGNVIYGRRKGD